MPNPFSANIRQSYEKNERLKEERNTVMNMEKHALFHLLRFLTFSYLGSCGNMLNQHMSDDLSHLQGCSAAALQPRTRRMHVSAFFSCIYSGGNYSKFIPV